MLELKNAEGEIIQTVLVGDQFRLPDGSVVSPAFAGWTHGGYSLSEAPEPEPESSPPTGEDVNKERDRRIREGHAFRLKDYPLQIPVSGDDASRENLINLGILAQTSLNGGQDMTFPFRDRNNTIHQLADIQMFELWQLGVQHISAIYQASWVLKDSYAEIPADYMDDKYWP